MRWAVARQPTRSAKATRSESIYVPRHPSKTSILAIVRTKEKPEVEGFPAPKGKHKGENAIAPKVTR
ncbi:hypothetical protein CC2G_010916 [Coprinopsis cinerea AmutBmut pab1-1]|nr:hypothetical protein CC2G_010916 [Coprinopsis cinerea AmutBmut pab1-1]